MTSDQELHRTSVCRSVDEEGEMVTSGSYPPGKVVLINEDAPDAGHADFVTKEDAVLMVNGHVDVCKITTVTYSLDGDVKNRPYVNKAPGTLDVVGETGLRVYDELLKVNGETLANKSQKKVLCKFKRITHDTFRLHDRSGGYCLQPQENGDVVVALPCSIDSTDDSRTYHYECNEHPDYVTFLVVIGFETTKDGPLKWLHGDNDKRLRFVEGNAPEQTDTCRIDKRFFRVKEKGDIMVLQSYRIGLYITYDAKTGKNFRLTHVADKCRDIDSPRFVDVDLSISDKHTIRRKKKNARAFQKLLACVTWMSTRQLKNTCAMNTYTEDTCTVNTCTQNGTCSENTHTKDTCKDNDTCICGTGMCTCTFLKEEGGFCKFESVTTYEGLRLQSVSGGAFIQPDKEGNVVAKHLGESCRVCWFSEEGRYDVFPVAITFKKTDTTVWCLKAETENTLQFVEVRPPEKSPYHAIDGYIFNIKQSGSVAIFESAQFHGRFIKYNPGKGSEIGFGLVNSPPCEKPGCIDSRAYDGCRFGLYSSSWRRRIYNWFKQFF